MSKKTIRIPAALADAWLEGLRSGKYPQARGALCVESEESGYCCLGVLQMVADGEVERHPNGDPGSLPSFGWQDGHGVIFTLQESGFDGYHDGAVVNGRSLSPYLPTLGCSANYANDSSLYTFSQIADAIEAALERT